MVEMTDLGTVGGGRAAAAAAAAAAAPATWCCRLKPVATPTAPPEVQAAME